MSSDSIQGLAAAAPCPATARVETPGHIDAPLELAAQGVRRQSSLMEIDAPTGTASGVTAEDWRKALSHVVPAVVVLRMTSTKSFDTESANCSHATGIIVDKKHGLILTNRHVIKPGPAVLEAVFLNREEIPVCPLYRDPVHDFGFLHYDPSAVKFMEYEEIQLAPEAAAVGLEIRVVGNDSGEKMSILAGTIARLDRDAPHYKKDGYNDFNTFYMQAASGTKGGSSGSPVIDCYGRAVAMNAGSKNSSSSAYYLPLDRVVRALAILRQEKGASGATWKPPVIPRGTLQMTLLHKGFDETRRLGLHVEVEKEVREASPAGETGMLVVESTVPGGPAHAHMEPGDVFVRVNGKVVTQFLDLETTLDDSVGAPVLLEVERGGKPITVSVTVQDLHSITPDSFVEISGGIIHSLSYQQARNFRFECGLVYVAEPGYMLSRAGVSKHAIITSLAGKPTPRLEEFLKVYQTLPPGTRVPLEFHTPSDRHRIKSVLVTVDRHEWYAPPAVYTRDDSRGLWHSIPAFEKMTLKKNSSTEAEEEGGSRKVGSADGAEVRSGKGSGEAGLDHEGPSANGRATPGDEGERLGESVAGDIGTRTAQMESEISGMGLRDFKDASVREGKEWTGEKRRRDEIEGAIWGRSRSGEGASVERGTGESRFEEGSGEGQEGKALPGENGVGREETGMASWDNGNSSATPAHLAEHLIEPALVMFDVHVPPSAMLDGVHSQRFTGTGLIVHHSAALGLVVVDRNTVAIAVSDIMLSFATFPIEIPAEVVFLHPIHNYAIVAYNPRDLGEAGAAVVRAATLLPDVSLQRGDPVFLVGLSRSLQVTSRRSIVTNPASALEIGRADSPRFRAVNEEVIEVDTDFGASFSGALADGKGRILALYSSFSTQLRYQDSGSEDHQFVKGMAIGPIWGVVQGIIHGQRGPQLSINGAPHHMPSVRMLEAELHPVLLSKARSFGLSDHWVQILARKGPKRRQVLRVKATFAGSRAEEALKIGDMLLAINGQPITSVRDVELACDQLDAELDGPGAARCPSAAEGESDRGALSLTILRQASEVQLTVGTDLRDGFGTTRMINWAGCMIQEPHVAVRTLGFLPPNGHGTYIARWCHGSPAHRYGLYALHWIVEINGVPTPNLDAFLSATKNLDHGAFVRLKIVHLNGKPKVLTLKQDLHYWPTWELRFDPAAAMWRRTVIKSHT